MSKRKRERMKAKERRHERSKPDIGVKSDQGIIQPDIGVKSDQGIIQPDKGAKSEKQVRPDKGVQNRTPQPKIRKVAEPGESFLHMKDALPEWRNLYEAVRKAML